MARFFIIRHIHNHTSIISSEMQVELKKNTAFTWGKWGEKKITPRLCSLGSTVWEQEKHLSNTKAQTRHSHRGSESGPASSHPVPQPLIQRWSDPLDQASRSKRTEANGRGGGMSVMSVGWGRNARASNCIAHPGRLQQQPCQGHCRGARKR